MNLKKYDAMEPQRFVGYYEETGVRSGRDAGALVSREIVAAASPGAAHLACFIGSSILG